MSYLKLCVLILVEFIPRHPLSTISRLFHDCVFVSPGLQHVLCFGICVCVCVTWSAVGELCSDPAKKGFSFACK